MARAWFAGVSRPIAAPVRRLIVLVLATGVALLEASACARDDGPGAGPGGSPPDAQAAAVPADAAKTDRPDAHDDASPPGDASSEAAIDAGPKPPFACAADGTFPGSLPVAEASAAAEVELKPGVRELLIVSDSGHSGAALLIALPSGVQRPITLPLDPGARRQGLERPASVRR